MPNYRDALETQVDLIRKYKSAETVDSPWVEVWMRGEDISRQQAETEIKDWLVDGLQRADTFYLRAAGLQQMMTADRARRGILSEIDLNDDEKLDRLDAEIKKRWEESIKEIAKDFFVYLEQGVRIPYGEEDEDGDLKIHALQLTHWRSKDKDDYHAIMYLFNQDERGLYLDRIEAYGSGNDNTPAAMAAFDFAANFCNFTQQKIASAFHQPLDRGTARRAKRVEISNPDIVVVTLRKTVRKDAMEGGISEPVFWTHQWDVKGHYHNYWYGSGDNKRLEQKWVKTYRKGPEQAPYIKKDRIYDVKR